ncbi:sulfite exporter TauE/SafE family protein [Peptococcaceae bacterium 1198_IL3148]
MEMLVLSSLIVFLASILQASTGFGFSIMATPFLLLIYEAHDAIQINIILSLLISFVMITKIWQDVDKERLISLVKGSIIGAPIGVAVFVYADVQMLKIVISILILVLTFLLMLNFSIKKSKGKDITAGGISGLLTTSLGMPGPPLLLYFTGVGTEKAILRSTTLAFYVFIYTVSLVMQIVFYGTTKVVWTSSLMSVPLVLLGIVLGQMLFKYVNQVMFRRITYVILFSQDHTCL